MSGRLLPRFSIRAIAGGEHNVAPVSGSRSRVSLNAGSSRSLAASTPSSYPAAIIMIRNRMISSRLCRTLSGARRSVRHFATRPARPARRATWRKSVGPASKLISVPSKSSRTGLPFKDDKRAAATVDCITMGGVPWKLAFLVETTEKYIIPIGYATLATSSQITRARSRPEAS